MQLLMRRQAEQPVVQEHLSAPGNPAGVMSEYIDDHGQSVEGALASFPIRVIEPNGTATLYQRQLTLGVSRWRPNP
jgi:hypothetical protein